MPYKIFISIQLIINLEMKKNPLSLKIITILLIILLINITGCLEEEPETRSDDEIENRQLEIDNISILPDWKDGDYHDYQKTAYKLKYLNLRYPDLVELFSIGKSVLNRNIWCIKIANEKSRGQKYSCVIDGTIHGSEWESGEICLYLAEYLLINYNYNKTITDIVDKSEIYLIPLLNPDGRQQDMRWNENGIDLNRNFDVHFGRLRGNNFPLGKIFGKIKFSMFELPGRGVFTNCGRYPFSEPETAALRDFMKSLDKKDLSFYVNCHTAVHVIAGTFNVYYKPEYTITKHEISVFNSYMDWINENTEYDAVYSDKFEHAGIGVAHDWVFEEFRVPSFVFELLNMDYEPWYRGGGKHDHLVHWMKASLPVLMYLIVNIENLHGWEKPKVEPSFPEGVPPVQLS